MSDQPPAAPAALPLPLSAEEVESLCAQVPPTFADYDEGKLRFASVRADTMRDLCAQALSALTLASRLEEVEREIPVELYSGHDVYVELGMDSKVKAGDVSEVLDAVVRLIRRNRKPTAPAAAQPSGVKA